MKREQHDAAFLITDDASMLPSGLNDPDRISRSLSRRKRSRGMFGKEERQSRCQQDFE